jgi:hypothetical protein
MNNKKAIIIREGFIKSFLNDLFTFGCLFSGWFLNHKFFDGSLVIDFTISFMALLSTIGLFGKKYNMQDIDLAIKELEAMKNNDI